MEEWMIGVLTAIYGVGCFVVGIYFGRKGEKAFQKEEREKAYRTKVPPKTS